jgi:ribonucleotide reductase alpha subunit
MKLQVIIRRSKVDFIMGRLEGIYDYRSNRRPKLDMKEIKWAASAIIKNTNAKLFNPNQYTPLLEYLENEISHKHEMRELEELEGRIKKFVSAKQVWVHHGRSTL